MAGDNEAKWDKRMKLERRRDWKDKMCKSIELSKSPRWWWWHYDKRMSFLFLLIMFRCLFFHIMFLTNLLPPTCSSFGTDWENENMALMQIIFLNVVCTDEHTKIKIAHENRFHIIFSHYICYCEVISHRLRGIIFRLKNGKKYSSFHLKF